LSGIKVLATFNLSLIFDLTIVFATFPACVLFFCYSQSTCWHFQACHRTLKSCVWDPQPVSCQSLGAESCVPCPGRMFSCPCQASLYAPDSGNNFIYLIWL